MSRPSPTVSASATEIDTVMPGGNGNYWIVKERSNDTRYWKDTRIDISKNKKTAGRIAVEINEPLTEDSAFVEIMITPSFYALLKKRPKFIDKEHGNGYLFGKMQAGYIYLGYVGNDIAQIGITDAGTSCDIKTSDYNALVKTSIKNNVRGHMWDRPQTLKHLHQLGHKNVLFLGDTIGGDVGADVFIHKNKNNEIDSLIIDNVAIFPDIEIVFSDR